MKLASYLVSVVSFSPLFIPSALAFQGHLDPRKWLAIALGGFAGWLATPNITECFFPMSDQSHRSAFMSIAYYFSGISALLSIGAVIACLVSGWWPMSR